MREGGAALSDAPLHQGGAVLAAPLHHAIAAKVRDCLCPYLGRGNNTSSQSVLTAAVFTDSNAPPPHIAADTELAYVWAWTAPK